jgi:hypothetical protein
MTFLERSDARKGIIDVLQGYSTFLAHKPEFTDGNFEKLNLREKF